MNTRRLLIISAFALLMVNVHSQTTSTDTLTFENVLTSVLNNYPSIKKIQTELEAAQAKIAIARSAYYPNVGIEASFAHLDPTSKINFPPMGTFQLFPSENYSASLNVNQMIWDFGKTEKNLKVEKESKKISELNGEQIKQRLSNELIRNYFSLAYYQEAIKINDIQIATLNELLDYNSKLEKTGSATKYEILTTQVNLSKLEINKTDLQNILKIQVAILNSYLGRPQESKLYAKNEIAPVKNLASNDSLFTYAFSHRPELKIADQKKNVAISKLEQIKAQDNPSLNFFANGGAKNGYIPDLNKFVPNYVVGVGLKVPLFDGNRIVYRQAIAKTEIQANDEDAELLRRNIVNEVMECKLNVEASLKKVKQSELQLQQAEEAYNMGKTRFKAGATTNLDLMINFSSMAESKLNLLKCKTEYTISLYKLKVALGDKPM